MIIAVADTHAAIWYLAGDARLSNTAKLFMDKAAQDGDKISISSITLIEMIYLIEKGRIPAQHFSQLATELDDPESIFTESPLDMQIARALSRVDVAQVPDMPDRILAATAVHLGVPIISRDSKIRLSTVRTIW